MNFFPDASEWNTQPSTVDLLLTSKSIIDARQLLNDANISYSVLIEDLQKDIENENPPKAQIEMLQNRKGKLFLVFFLLYHTILHIICLVVVPLKSITRPITTLEPVKSFELPHAIVICWYSKSFSYKFLVISFELKIM